MKQMTTQFDLILLILRVVAGPTIFWHGYNKMFKGGRIKGTAGWFDSMGMKPNGTVHAYAASLTEMGCGVLLLLGLLSPFAAAGVISVMVVAGWTVHRHAFLITKEGTEYVLVLGTLCFAIGSFGSGTWSLDHAFGLCDGYGMFLDTELLCFAITLGLGLGAGILTLLACYRPPKKDTAPSGDDAAAQD
ncbi:DoxX family protein [soil metagenome]